MNMLVYNFNLKEINLTLLARDLVQKIYRIGLILMLKNHYLLFYCLNCS